MEGNKHGQHQRQPHALLPAPTKVGISTPILELGELVLRRASKCGSWGHDASEDTLHGILCLSRVRGSTGELSDFNIWWADDP